MLSLVKKDFFIILIITIIGALLRFYFLSHPDFVLDSDEAIVGLMAKHINEGKGIPAFYYGQHYMGAFEPILVALSFKLFGIGQFGLKFIPFLFSVFLIPLMYIAGLQLGSVLIARVSSLIMAIPPAALLIWSLKARGGFVELIAIGLLSFIFIIRFYKTHKLIYLLITSFLIGFGWWTNNQIIYFILPIGLLTLIYSIFKKEAKLKSFVRNLFGSIVFFLIGSLPYWVYNIKNEFKSFELFAGSEEKIEYSKHLNGFLTEAVPILIGARRFWSFDDLFSNSFLIVSILYIFLFLCFICYLICNLFKDRNLKYNFLYLILLFTVPFVFIISHFGYLSFAPRYLLPIYPAIFIVLSIGLVFIRKINTKIFNITLSLVLAINLLSLFYKGPAIPKEPFVAYGDRVSKDQTELINWLNNNDFKLVKTNYWIGYRLAFETNEEVKFLIIDEPNTPRILDYEIVKENKYQEVPLVLVKSQANVINQVFKEQGLDYKTIELSGYTVFYDILPINSNLREVDKDNLIIETNFNSEKSKFVLDDNIKTRWGSGSPQNEEMFFNIKFKDAKKIKAIEYQLGGWSNDFPRNLEFLLFKNGDLVKKLTDSKSYEYFKYSLKFQNSLMFYLEDLLVDEIKLLQVGTDPFFDWSIAEINIYE